MSTIYILGNESNLEVTQLQIKEIMVDIKNNGATEATLTNVLIVMQNMLDVIDKQSTTKSMFWSRISSLVSNLFKLSFNSTNALRVITDTGSTSSITTVNTVSAITNVNNSAIGNLGQSLSGIIFSNIYASEYKRNFFNR
jgi:hypothetical protein